ncbi:very short patch repair endonuclease [Pseudomonadota bacterium]
MTKKRKQGTDVMTPAQRSWCMSRIRGQNTGPELILRKALWRRGLRYRLKNRLPGRPDVIFPGRRIAVFVDGCFWHGCMEHGVAPKNNAEFWKKKLKGNKVRDAEVNAQLEELGWTVIRIWEHEVRSDVESAIDCVQSAIETESEKNKE